MINKIKDDIVSKKGQKLDFRFNGSRNQIEEFTGIIMETYNYVFTIRVIDEINENNELKSFTYSDILIDNLEIIKK